MTEYAGFWRRFMAWMVDMLWLAPLLGGILYLNKTFDLETFLININEVLPGLLILVLLILWFWIRYGATPGKLLFDCEIVDARTGEAIGLGKALLRLFAYIISVLFFGLGFLWIMWDKRKQGWHDKIAGTMVVIHDEATVPLYQLVKFYR